MVDEVKRLVYIEDEQEMIDLVRLILNRRGYEVIGANGGREGLDAVRKYLPHLVLLDLMMPDMDGWDVCQQMQADEEMCKIPVVVVTAKTQSVDRIFGFETAKVKDYITKPFGSEELRASVDRILGK